VSNPVILPNGSQEWYQEGLLHRLDGPAVIRPSGYQAWHLDGKYHRIDGPAWIHPDGYQYWYQEDKLHRLDDPAAIWKDGTQAWYQEGLRHRLDGPAIIHPNGTQEIWIWGEIPRIWNNHVVTDVQLDLEFPSARHLPQYINCTVWQIDDPEERTLAILKYS
jgi:hypothetical protein